MNKFIKYSTISIIFFSLLIFFFNVSKNYLRSNLSVESKSKIRNFLNNVKNKDLSDYTIFEFKRSKYLSENKFNKNFFDDNGEFNSNLILKKNINSFLKMNIKYFELPLNSYKKNKNKPVAFVDIYQDNILIVSGDGQIFKVNKESFNKKNIVFKTMRSNIYDFINNPLIKKRGEFSIKSILIDQDQLYISFTSMIKNNCFSMKIVKTTLIEDKLNFENFFNPKECVKKKHKNEFSALQTGGKMINYKNDKILINIGEYRNRTLAQNINSIFGKVLIINKNTKEYEVLSLGHRNQLGMYFDEEKETLIMSEMGPKGGDEININKNLENNLNNYGWPISSYGNHYSGTFKKDAPLYKSHKKYGFIEPIKYWNPSIAPSQIKKIPFLKQKNENILLLSALGYRDKESLKEGDQSLHFLFFNSKYSRLNKIKIIKLRERVRDFVYIGDKKIIFIFESIPAIGIAKISGNI